VAFSGLDGAGSVPTHSLHTHVGGATFGGFGVGLAVAVWSDKGVGGVVWLGQCR